MLEHFITNIMAVGVVYRFKVINIQHNQGNGALMTLGNFNIMGSPLQKVAEIRYPCQSISSGQQI